MARNSMDRHLSNVPASVHDRLLNQARDTGRPFNELLQYYGIERFLYRLAQTEHAQHFILKGGASPLNGGERGDPADAGH